MMLFDESKSVETINANGRGSVVLLCEHASNHVPEDLNGLGLTDAQLDSHIAWDPGALAVSLALSNALDAPLVASRISRLVYDCNRPPDSPGAMARRSETTDIPGNVTMSDADKDARIQGVYLPFVQAVTSLLDARKKRGLDGVLVTIHSFTRMYFGQPREVELGILHDTDSRLADAMLSEAERLPNRIIRRNEPYGPEDGVTHSLVIHGIANQLHNVMIEIRSDLLESQDDCESMAREVLALLHPALERITQTEMGRA